MKSLINRRGSKAATRALKRFGNGSASRTRPSAVKADKSGVYQPVKSAKDKPEQEG